MTPKPKTLKSDLKKAFSNQILKISEIWPYFLKIYKKPILALYILISSWKSHLFLAASVVALIMIVSPAVNYGLSKIFPPQHPKKVLGFLKKETHPAKIVFSNSILGLFWVITIGNSLALYWLSIPKGIKRSELISEKLMKQSNDLLNINKKNADRYYKLATALTLDQIEKSISKNSQTIANRYQIEKTLGQGAMGVVHLANDTILDRKVAMKELAVNLAGDEQFITRFRQEAKALARLSHPNIVQVYDFINEPARLWMVLEFINGSNLSDLIDNIGKLEVEDTVTYISQIAKALSYAHENKIIHRDLKPANILLTENNQIKVTDFGISKITNAANLTQEGSVLGSPAYMSPEQINGDPVDERSDIYALGITSYEMLTGSVPFQGDTTQILSQHLVKEAKQLFTLNTEIPEKLSKLIMSMLAKNPDERPGSMLEVAAYLKTNFTKQLTAS